MIRDHLLASGSDYVQLIWTYPQFVPETYQVTYTCTMISRFTPTYDMKYNITSTTQYLSSDTTSFRISDLRPRSNCTLILLAVYNWASVDSGITITGTTIDEDTSKKYFGLNHFIITLYLISCLLLSAKYLENFSCKIFRVVNSCSD